MTAPWLRIQKIAVVPTFNNQLDVSPPPNGDDLATSRASIVAAASAMRIFTTRVVVPLAFGVALMSLSACQYNSIFIRFEDNDPNSNYLVNGSFELGDFQAAANDPGRMIVPAGNTTTIKGWTVIGGAGTNVDWLQNSFTYVKKGASDGNQWLDLTGESPEGGPKQGVRQDFVTTSADFEYILYFDIGVCNHQAGQNDECSSPYVNARGPITVLAKLTGPTGESYGERTCGPFDPTEFGVQWWKQCQLRFTPKNANTTLTITGTQGNQMIGLDNVRVFCIAPLGNHNFCRN